MNRRQRQMAQIAQQHQQHGEAHQGAGALVEVAEKQRDTGHQQCHHRHCQQAHQTDQQFLRPVVLTRRYVQSQPHRPGYREQQQPAEHPEPSAMEQQHDFFQDPGHIDLDLQ
ncbi:hypothetical protein D3C80_656610 [compost metagenome]